MCMCVIVNDVIVNDVIVNDVIVGRGIYLGFFVDFADAGMAAAGRKIRCEKKAKREKRKREREGGKANLYKHRRPSTKPHNQK